MDRAASDKRDNDNGMMEEFEGELNIAIQVFVSGFGTKVKLKTVWHVSWQISALTGCLV